MQDGLGGRGILAGEELNRISILHGGGGLYMQKLLKEHIIPRFKSRRFKEIPLDLLAAVSYTHLTLPTN